MIATGIFEAEIVLSIVKAPLKIKESERTSI